MGNGNLLVLHSGNTTHAWPDVPKELFLEVRRAWEDYGRTGKDGIYSLDRADDTSYFSIKLSLIDAISWKQDKADGNRPA